MPYRFAACPPSVAEYSSKSIIGAAATISKEGRSISWANISALLGIPSSTIRDSAGRAGVGTIQEIQDFILDGSQQVLQDVIVTGKVRDKIDIAESDDGATVSVTSVSSKNKTIASVVKQCQVDLDLYEIVSPKVRKWDVPIKQKDADDSTRLEIVECYYIGFSLVLKSSIHIISPIVAHIKFAPPVTMRSATPDGSSEKSRGLAGGVEGGVEGGRSTTQSGGVSGGISGGVSGGKLNGATTQSGILSGGVSDM